MLQRIFLALLLITAGTSCSGGCDANQATNKMLALNKVQGRLASHGSAVDSATSVALAKESGAISELIAQQKYGEACEQAEALAKRMGLDLAKEQEGMLTIEQLAKDGGKGSGTCSVADAAKKQMEVHAMLQAEVDAGKRTSDIFAQFGEDTKGYAELLATNPSKACELLEELKKRYGL